MARCTIWILQLVLLQTVLLFTSFNQQIDGKYTEQNLIYADPADPQASFTDTCNPECKYGDCNNSTCVCMTIFQGDDCRQPKPWFIGAVCAAGTIVLIVVMSLLCCICSSCFGCKKKQTITVAPTT